MKNQEFMPFKWPWAISRFHCNNCGEVREIDMETVQQLLRVMATLGNFPEVAISKEEDWKKYYFDLPYCDNCNKTNDKEYESECLKLKLIED